MKPKLHRDGTVTYWSVYQQAWIERAEAVPDAELAAMGLDRERVLRHLAQDQEPATRWVCSRCGTEMETLDDPVEGEVEPEGGCPQCGGLAHPTKWIMTA